MIWLRMCFMLKKNLPRLFMADMMRLTVRFSAGALLVGLLQEVTDIRVCSYIMNGSRANLL